MLRTIFGLALVATLVAPPNARAAELTIIIENVTQEKGLLHIAVFDESGYKVDGNEQELALRWLEVEPKSPSTTLVLDDIPLGQYAIKARQDLNGNHKLDSNFLGMPKEPWGVSIATGKLGLPDYKKAAFDVKMDTTISVQLR